MARPRKEGMDYFPHDTDAVNDTKIESLRMLYGNDGYAFYFILLELIYKQSNFELDVSDAETIQILAKKVDVTEEKFNSMLKTAIKRGCFDAAAYADRGVLTSEGIKKRSKVVTDKREKMRQKFSKDAGKEIAPDSCGVSDAEMGEESTQSKVKESKVKKSESKVNSTSTTTDDDFKKIEKTYSALHGCLGLKPKEWPLVQDLINKGIGADLIIEVMQEKHAKKISEGGSVNSFSFYTNAINERFEQTKETPGAYDWIDDL